MSKQPKPWPHWIDEEAVYTRVQGELQEPERLDAMFWAENWDLMPDRTLAEIRRDIAGGKENKALDAWRRGDRKPLADLVDPDDPMLDYLLKKHDRPINDRPIRRQLSAETWSIIRDCVLGKPRKRGRPKATAEERRMRNPKHDAAAMVPAIKAILRRRYPDKAKRDVKDRACAFAERLMGMDDPESNGSKVSNYLQRGGKDRGYLPP